MFRKDLYLVPFGVRMTKIDYGSSGYIGWAEYYVFGIRIAKIQKTEPW